MKSRSYFAIFYLLVIDAVILAIIVAWAVTSGRIVLPVGW